MFENFIRMAFKIVDGFRQNILPFFDFLIYEYSFNNPFTVEIGDVLTFTVFDMIFGVGLIYLLGYKIILSLTPVV